MLPNNVACKIVQDVPRRRELCLRASRLNNAEKKHVDGPTRHGADV
jgi:hypothetical protein